MDDYRDSGYLPCWCVLLSLLRGTFLQVVRIYIYCLFIIMSVILYVFGVKDIGSSEEKYAQIKLKIHLLIFCSAD